MKPSAIARRESSLGSGKHSPSVATLKRYALNIFWGDGSAAGDSLCVGDKKVSRKLGQLRNSVSGVADGNAAERVEDE